VTVIAVNGLDNLCFSCKLLWKLW